MGRGARHGDLSLSLLCACYSQTGITVNTRNISGMLLSCKRKANQESERQSEN